MQLQIEEGFQIGLQQNEIQERLKDANANSAKIEKKVQEFKNAINQKREIIQLVGNEIVSSSIIEQLESKLQESKEHFAQQKIQINEQKQIELNKVESVDYDYTFQKLQKNIQVYQSAIQDLKSKQDKQRHTQNQIELQKNQAEQDEVQEYILIKERIKQENTKIAEMQFQIHQIEEKKMKEKEKLNKLCRNQEMKILKKQQEEEHRIEQEAQQQKESVINILEQKQIDLQPKLKVTQSQLMAEEINLLKSKEILLNMEKDEIQGDRTFRMLAGILVVLLCILITKCLNIIQI